MADPKEPIIRFIRGVLEYRSYSISEEGTMSDEINRELFDHLVTLAALELPADESEYLRRQLNNQLKAIHELVAIPLDPGTGITSHGVPYTAQISAPEREDEWQPFSNPDEILEQAPETDDRYIVVPDIPHTDLS
jgi:aspartyl-tRNA(Asn)/glutamyl-tRNA(Gln) amidotransferase subunit C